MVNPCKSHEIPNDCEISPNEIWNPMIIPLNSAKITMKLPIPLKSVKNTINSPMKSPEIHRNHHEITWHSPLKILKFPNFSWPQVKAVKAVKASPQRPRALPGPRHVLVVGHRDAQLGGVLLAGLLGFHIFHILCLARTLYVYVHIYIYIYIHIHIYMYTCICIHIYNSRNNHSNSSSNRVTILICCIDSNSIFIAIAAITKTKQGIKMN